MFCACDTLKNMMTQDLEDEDFVVGQLYVDEVVDEVPVISRPVTSGAPASRRQRGENGEQGTQAGGNTNALGLRADPGDNNALYEAVNTWLGVPYKYGGTDRSGIDCSGFVGLIFKQVYNVTLHRTSNDMLRDVSLVTRGQLREGDIVFFTNSKGKVSHVGIYLKDDLFAHASTTNGVSVSSLDDKYWSKHFYKGGRVK